MYDGSRRTSPSERATRGSGLLEPLLARLRARRAEACIPESLRGGRLLDIGCGAGCGFARQTRFAEKHGVDRLEPTSRDGINFQPLDFEAFAALPYPGGHFQVVTMLAVAEHLSVGITARVFEEAYRVLAPGGRFVLTTPAPWSHGLLRGMAAVGLVSRAEIEEHQHALSRRSVVESLASAGFQRGRIESGYFEGGLNIWAAASK